MNKTDTLYAQKVLHMLESQTFVDWYEEVFIPNYVEDSILSKEKILMDIHEMVK